MHSQNQIRQYRFRFGWLLCTLFFILLLTNNESIANDLKKIKDNNTISDKLIEAEQARHTDPKLFKQLIIDIASQRETLTSQQVFHLLFLQGYLATYHGKYDKADELLSKLLVSEASDLIKFRANYTLINVAAAKKDWSKGLRHIAMSTKMLSNIKDKEFYQGSILTAIIFYNQLRQHELVLNHVNKLKEQELPLKHLCFLEQFALEAKLNLTKVEPDALDFDSGIEVCQTAKNDISLNIIRLFRARLYLDLEEPDRAIEILTRHIDEINNTLFPMLIAGVYNHLAKSYYQLNKFEDAKLSAQKALDVNNSNAIIQQSVDSYETLYLVAKKQNKLELAITYHEKYSALDRQHLEGEKAKHMAFQLAQHQAFEQEAEIKLLNEQNTLLATKQALSEAEVANTRLIIAFLVVSLILLTLWGGRLYKAHKRIKELAEYDALTGIFNRGHFTHVANSALKYCQNAEQDISVIIFDLDYFKTVNDSYGHATGDWALKEATRVCKNLGRKNDIFARIGGEEFCILLPSCNIRSAALRAEECRHAIEDIITEASGHDFRITASFGVTDAKTSGFNLEKLLADADEAAYTSKHSGRNRVTVHEVETTPKQAQLDGSWSIS